MILFSQESVLLLQELHLLFEVAYFLFLDPTLSLRLFVFACDFLHVMAKLVSLFDEILVLLLKLLYYLCVGLNLHLLCLVSFQGLHLLLQALIFFKYSLVLLQVLSFP